MCVGVSSAEVPSNLFERCDIVLGGPHQATAFLKMLAAWANPQTN
jgi:hypothetical protein